MLQEKTEINEATDAMEVVAKANRTHSDSMFRILFQDPEKLLELFNAIGNTNYEDASEIKLNTLKNVNWQGRKNDISFTFGERLITFIEHQSSVGGNMPVRMLSFAAKIYEKLIPEDALYGTKQTPIPTPEFYVLYIGETPQPKERILKLSDAFIDKDSTNKSLEVVVKVININYLVQGEILDRSSELRSYSYFIYLVKQLRQAGSTLEEAIYEATKHCIEQDILREFLRLHSTEVINMLEWDAEKAAKALQREARQEGHAEGRHEEKIESTKKLLQTELSLTQISEVTGLSRPTEIETIKQEIEG